MAQPSTTTNAGRLARRMFDAMFALGFTDYRDTYFAGRAAPLGASVPAGVVDALLYGFGPGEVARHVPQVWSTTTPEAAIAAREAGCVRALRTICSDLLEGPSFIRAVGLLTRAATSATVEGRPLYAALLALPVPDEPVARLFHAASLLREHRGFGPVAALTAEVDEPTTALEPIAQRLVAAQDRG